MRRILCVEPAYSVKYPPLGLMKIYQFHRLVNDYVKFVRGVDDQALTEAWDRVYVSTLFTYYWDITVRTINAYKGVVKSPSDVVVGGVMASLMADELRRETGATIIIGLLDRAGMLGGNSRLVVDDLVPCYDMLSDVEYKYAAADAYFVHSTRGCPNSCKFCAVRILEPEFRCNGSVYDYVEGVRRIYGEKSDLLFMDNNVLASPKLLSVLDDVVDLGFYKGAKLFNRSRKFDCNQGIDARLLTLENMKALSQTCLTPVRLAYDSSGFSVIYEKAVRIAASCGADKYVTYVLFNYMESPYEFYERLRHSINLNVELGIRISSFPMKYVPLKARDRSFIGAKWNKRWLRGIQCVLLATHGIVSPHVDYFDAAFGKSYDEFIENVSMPDRYIIDRSIHKANGALAWRRAFRELTDSERSEYLHYASLVARNRRLALPKTSARVRELLAHF